jgi:hypothetical protein
MHKLVLDSERQEEYSGSDASPKAAPKAIKKKKERSPEN